MGCCQVNGAFINFFGFNGTAGVWRIKALEDSGGWLDRTTVEDMDIAVRAHLKGWKMIFLNDVQVGGGGGKGWEGWEGLGEVLRGIGENGEGMKWRERGDERGRSREEDGKGIRFEGC